MLYLAAFAAALLVDTIPVFAPPAWIILAFMNSAHGHVSWQIGLTATAGLRLISCVLFIDWRQLLGHKKFRLNFRIWKP